MGGDAGKDRTGLRPDSMTVASVDAETGRTVLISLPRNLEDVPFPESSPLHKKFPNGYSCPDHSCMLNAVYTYAMGHKDLYPGVRNPGAQATKEAVEGATGLKINYWALIDLKGFEALVDAVGGITIDVNRDIPIGGGHAKMYGYVKKGKNQHLDGRSALWFARSRSDSSDYDRMARQKCVMSAMLQQLDPVTVLTNFNQIAAAGKEIVATDIPTSRVDTMMDLAMKAKAKPIATLGVRAADDLSGRSELRQDPQDGRCQDRGGRGGGQPHTGTVDKRGGPGWSSARAGVAPRADRPLRAAPRRRRARRRRRRPPVPPTPTT